MNFKIYPENYKNTITKEEWKKMFYMKEIFNDNSKIVVKCLLETGEASCTELAIKYGRTKGFYNAVSSKLGIRIHKFTGCDLCNELDSKYWPILFTGRYIDENNKKVGFLYRLVDNLREALLEMDLSYIDCYKQ